MKLKQIQTIFFLYFSWGKKAANFKCIFIYYHQVLNPLTQRLLSESEKNVKVKKTACNTNGFFHPQTVLVSAKFENMSFTKSSPTSDSRSFEHFFLSLVVHSSRQNRQTLSQQMR